MADNYTFPGSNNTFVPSLEATGGLIIEFSRSPDSFALNKYVGLKKVDKPKGYWVQMLNQQGARLANNFDWAAGADAPKGNVNNEAHEFLGYTTQRKAFAWSLDQRAVDVAAWDIVSQESRIHAMEAMTYRTNAAGTVLTTSGNWGANTGAESGAWSTSTSTTHNIKTDILTAVGAITIATNGVIQMKDLQLIINPNLAKLISSSPEFIDFLKQQSNSIDIFRGDKSFNSTWGLGDMLYGLPVVIETTVKVTNLAGGTRAAGYVIPDNVAVIAARPDAIVPAGGPTFNTCTLFMYEEMTVETFNDVNNRRLDGRVVEDYVPLLTAPQSGWLITSIT